MAKRERAFLGIDLQTDTIRIVEIRLKSNRPYVNFAASAVLPAGAMESGLVQQPAVVANVLKTLLENSGAERSARAVIGVPLERTAFRNVSLPPAPDSEFASMVAGEVEHFGMVRAGRGAHGYFRLKPPVKTSAADPIAVSLVAVDEDVTHALREVADRADVPIDALEPTTLGMYRTALIEAGAATAVCALVIGTVGSEITYAVEGQLVTYRRLETGSLSLRGLDSDPSLQGLPPVQAYGDGPGIGGGTDRQDVPQAFANAYQGSDFGDSQPPLSDSAVGMLGIEVRRTLEYLEREYPNVIVADRLYVVIDVPELLPLASRLQEKLGIPVELVRPRAGSTESGSASKVLTSDQGYTFAAAYGLAMQQAPSGVRAPKVDLFSTERSAAVTQESSRNLLGSILVSVAAILLAFGVNFLYNKQITTVDAATQVTVSQSAQIKAQIDETQQQRALHAKQYKLLRSEGAPIGIIMDYIVGSLAPGVGLTNISVDQGLKVRIEGEAVDEKPMLATVQDLQKSPVLNNLVISSFTRVPNLGLNFALEATTVGMDRIRLPDEKPDFAGHANP